MAQAVVWGKCPFRIPDRTTTVLTEDFYSLRHPVRENALVISEVHLRFRQIFLTSSFQTHVGRRSNNYKESNLSRNICLDYKKKMQCSQQQYILICVSVLFISVKYHLFWRCCVFHDIRLLIVSNVYISGLWPSSGRSMKRDIFKKTNPLNKCINVRCRRYTTYMIE